MSTCSNLSALTASETYFKSTVKRRIDEQFKTPQKWNSERSQKIIKDGGNANLSVPRELYKVFMDFSF